MQLVDALRPVTIHSTPFEVTLDKVILRPHLLEPNLQLVMLAEQRRPVKETRLYILRENLRASILHLITETAYTRTISRIPFHPHITLTRGLTPIAARALLNHVRIAPIAARFTVTQVTLMGFDENQDVVQRLGLPFNVSEAETFD